MELTYQTETKTVFHPRAGKNVALRTITVSQGQERVGEIVEDVSGAFFLNLTATQEYPDATVYSIDEAYAWFESRYAVA